MPNGVAVAIVGVATALTFVRWAAPGDNQALSIITLALFGLMLVWGRDVFRSGRSGRAGD